MNRHLRQLYNEAAGKLKGIVNGLDSCAITHDGWTSIATESFGTVTLHYVDSNWQLVNVVLQTRKVVGRHTADAIQNQLSAAQVEWGFPDPIATCDNAANEVKAFRQLGWTQLSCMGHNINLAVKAALSVPEVNKLVVKGRKVVQYFHKSSNAYNSLFEKQKLLLPPNLHGHKLIVDVDTRWNSTLEMLQRLLEQTAAIHAVLADPVFRGKVQDMRYLYSTDDQINVETVVEFLEPFKEATLSLSREDEPTVAAVLPVLIKLEKHVTLLPGDIGWLKDMKQKALQSLDKRYASPEQKRPLLLASILHPRSKKLTFLSDNDKHLAESYLRTEVFNIKNNPKTPPKTSKGVPIKTEVSTEVTNGQNQVEDVVDGLENAQALELPQHVVDEINKETLVTDVSFKEKQEVPGIPPCKKLKPDVMAWLDEIFFPGKSHSVQEDPETVINREIDLFLSSDYSTEKALKWWQDRESTFPNVAKAAKKFLCIPASSVPSRPGANTL